VKLILPGYRNVIARLAVWPLICLWFLHSDITAKPLQVVVDQQEMDSVRIGRGDEVLLKLPARLSSGYIWTPMPEQQSCSVKELHVDDGGSGVTTASVYQVFAIVCKQKAKVSLGFFYARELTSRPDKTYRICLEVD
jgi:hypothetical protein